MPRRGAWDSADVEDVERVIRSVEHPELRTIGSQRETVARRIRAEAGVPGEALEVDDVGGSAVAHVDHPEAEQATLRDVHRASLRVGLRQRARVERRQSASRELPGAEIEGVRTGGGAQRDVLFIRRGGGDVVRSVEAQLTDESMVLAGCEEARGA